MGRKCNFLIYNLFPYFYPTRWVKYDFFSKTVPRRAAGNP
jgi:hypothetical protein